MKIKPFFPVFLTLVGVVIYAYYAAEKKPDRAVTATPRQYIEMVEKNKAERREKEGAAALDRDTGENPSPE